jgi:hypothetical protein
MASVVSQSIIHFTRHSIGATARRANTPDGVLLDFHFGRTVSAHEK